MVSPAYFSLSWLQSLHLMMSTTYEERPEGSGINGDNSGQRGSESASCVLECTCGAPFCCDHWIKGDDRFYLVRVRRDADELREELGHRKNA